MDYAESDAGELAHYLTKINRLLRNRGVRELQLPELRPSSNQLKVLIDVCHLYGIAVLLDVVYNHAGSAVKEQTSGLWFFDEMPRGNANESLYFTDRDHTGPVFAFWEGGEDHPTRDVQGFLINNARFFLEEYKIDGLRYDQVTVIDEHGGWFFAQRLSDRARAVDRRRVHIAEFWHKDRFKGVLPPEDGLGFDAVGTTACAISSAG
jgi:1,4-alpha-glucan branching enzyme